jgi:hypothetical protein
MLLSSAVAEYVAACSAIERLVVFIQQLVVGFWYACVSNKQATPIMEDDNGLH